MKPIYVDDMIYSFLSSQRKDYGSFNNVVKAVLRKLAELQEDAEDMQIAIEENNSYVKGVLLESVKHPQNVSSYSEGARTMNVTSGPPQPQKIPEKSGFARDLQLVFNAMEGDSVKPSDFLKIQEKLVEKTDEKLSPPPPPPKVIVLDKPQQDES